MGPSFEGKALSLAWPAEGVALATMTRAKEMNTLSLDLIQELETALDHAERSGCRALVITGSGRAFCCGAHLAYFTTDTAAIGAAGFEVRDNYLARIAGVFERLEAAPFPIIAAVNGFALGGGCEMALACDFRIMAEDAKLGLPETRIGATPGAGGVQKLHRFVGRGKALEWILLGSHLTAAEAERFGLLYQVVAAESVLDAALQLAERFRSLAPRAVAQAKMSVHVSGDTDLKTAKLYGLESLAALVGGAEWREGMSAFMEKRAPRFVGPRSWKP